MVLLIHNRTVHQGLRRAGFMGCLWRGEGNLWVFPPATLLHSKKQFFFLTLLRSNLEFEYRAACCIHNWSRDPHTKPIYYHSPEGRSDCGHFVWLLVKHKP